MQTRHLGGAALALVVASASAVCATAGPTLTFTLTSRQGPTAVHPHPPAGGAGDTYVSSLELRNRGVAQFGRGRSASVGTMQFTYTIRRQCAGRGESCVSRADFDSVTRLPEGTVTAGGASISISSPTITLAVTGGTGRFRGARGTVTISPGSHERSTYDLELPP